tara:strand:- start:33 stop:785 length:753 start_codon:yes stop_codon:yes gene_type:complete
MNELVEVRRLNQRGMSTFAAIDWQKTGAAGNPPSHILFDDDFTKVVIFSNGNTRSIDPESKFSTKRELAKLLDRALGNRDSIEELTEDPGLWAWLALLYYDQLRQSIGEYGWKSAESSRFIPVGSAFRYYRHQVSGPFIMWRLYGEKAAVFIDGPANTGPEVNEQILSVSALASSESIIKTASLLYHNPAVQRGVKKGAGGKGPGSARRFREVFWQFYETYDLSTMSPEQILSILPEEFDKFNPLVEVQE